MTHQTNFSVGNLVKIVDPAEHPSEWAIFVIANIESSRHSLTAKDKRLCEPLWVTSDEIILASSENNSSKVCPNCKGKGRYQTFIAGDGWTDAPCHLCNPRSPWYKQYNPDK